MKRRANASGFTLVELLVAATIALLLAAVMLAVTGGALGLWRRAQDAFTTNTQARLVLDYLARDLQTAIFRDDGNTWLAVDGFDATLVSHGWVTSGAMKPAVFEHAAVESRGSGATIADARFGRSGLWLRLISSNVAAETAGRSLPIAVSYQVVRRSLTSSTSSAPETIRYALFRAFASSENTFATGYGIHAYDTALIRPTLTDAIATNVIDFGVWFYRRENDGRLRRIFPETATDSAHRVDSRGNAPIVADVMVRILSEEGANAISAIERGLAARPAGFASNEAWWWSTAMTHSRVYVRRIEVGGGGG